MREERRRRRAASVDHAGPGTYFVTFVTDERRCVLGTVREDGAFRPSAIGQACARYAQALPERFLGYELRALAIMPNHIHAIVSVHPREDAVVAPLGRAIGWWKARASAAARKGGFLGVLWQPSFYERAIRSERDLAEIQRYIANNPRKWHLDQHYRRMRYPQR